MSLDVQLIFPFFFALKLLVHEFPSLTPMGMLSSACPQRQGAPHLPPFPHQRVLPTVDRPDSTDRSKTAGATCRPPLHHLSGTGRAWPWFTSVYRGDAADHCARQQGQVFLLNRIVWTMELKEQEMGGKEKGCWEKATAANERKGDENCWCENWKETLHRVQCWSLETA